MVKIYPLIRKWLQSSRSKENLGRKVALLTALYWPWLESIYYLAEHGNKDVLERLGFLRKECRGDVLDIGCFDGFYCAELAKKGCKVVGVDFLQRFLNYAQKKLNKDLKEVSFRKAYAEALPFEDNSFDTTILSHTLEHVFDPELALKEAARVTRRSGKLISIVPDRLGNSPAHLRYISSSDLLRMMDNHCSVGAERRVGIGIAYVGIIR